MISAYQDGELSATEREEVKRHLEACAECRGLLQDFQIIASAVKEACAVDPDQEVDLSCVLDEIEKQVELKTPLWERMKKSILQPKIWLPAAALTAAAVLVFFAAPFPSGQATVEKSRVESVYSNGTVMVLQTPESSRPLIWVIPAPQEGEAT